MMFFLMNCFSELAYTSQPYSETMAMRPYVTHTTCDTSSREQTGNIITFTQFEEGNLLSETINNAESGNESNENSIVPLLLSKEEMYGMDDENESYYEPMSMEMLEEICDGSQSHPNANRGESRYKIRDHIGTERSVKSYKKHG